MPNIHEIIRDHVSLSISCLDRLYVNGYVPRLQTSGQLYYFMHEHLDMPVPSPAVLQPIRDRFVADVRAFSERNEIPCVRFERGQRKDDIANERRSRFTRREGVVFIGIAQERMRSFKFHKRTGTRGGVSFDFSRQSVFVNHYYFYLQDRDWGPAFIKVGSYLPYPVKLCLNGHEWAKQRLRRERLVFDSLDNGFLSCRRPQRLQEVCDSLGAADVQAFFDRWSHLLPWPLTLKDRAAGFFHRLALWQVEVSLTQVFDRPVQGRHFFEEVIRENLDLGRPDRVSLVFPTRVNRRTPPPAFGYRTRIITDGVNPSVHFEYKHSHVKQYFKENQALRIETTVNDPRDFGLNKNLSNLDALRSIGHYVNARLLETQRVSHNCVLDQIALDRLQRPSLDEAGLRAPALRFGDARVMALFQAVCRFAHLPEGFTNRDIRSHVAALLGLSLDLYNASKMTYDLRRLRRKGLITRRPRSHRYSITAYGLKVALFCSKVYLRILRPAWASLVPNDPLPRPLHNALAKLDAELHRFCDNARLGTAS
jgi:hypothetical protein